MNIAGMYSTLCTVIADETGVKAAANPLRAPDFSIYYRLDFEIILSFGLTELTAQLCWKENVSWSLSTFKPQLISNVLLGLWETASVLFWVCLKSWPVWYAPFQLPCTDRIRSWHRLVWRPRQQGWGWGVGGFSLSRIRGSRQHHIDYGVPWMYSWGFVVPFKTAHHIYGPL